MREKRHLRRVETPSPDVFEVEFQTETGLGRGRVHNFTIMGCELRLLWMTGTDPLTNETALKNLTFSRNSVNIGFAQNATIRHLTHKPTGIHFGLEYQIQAKEIRTEKSTFASHRENEYPIDTNTNFRPLIKIPNPLHYQDTIHAEVQSFSATSLRLLTSARNRMFFPNQTLPGCDLALPTIGSLKMNLKILSACPAEKTGKLILNCHMESIGTVALSSLTGYALRFCLPTFTIQEKALAITSAGLPFKMIRQYFDYSPAQTASDFEQIVVLRRRAYTRSKKIRPDTEDFKMADAFDLSSVIIVAKLDQQVVGSVRGTLVRTQTQSFELEQSISLPKKINRYEAFEVSRLCVESELEGTDVVLGLLERISEVGIKAGTRWVITSCIAPDFQKYVFFGFKDSGKRFDLKTLQGVPHMFIIQDARAALLGKTMNMLHWVGTYSGISDYLARFGYLRNSRRTVFIKVRQWVARRIYQRITNRRIQLLDRKKTGSKKEKNAA